MDDTHGISDGNINISDVIEVIQTTDPEFGMEDTRVTPSNNSRSAPYIKIIEQPASKALRFRYECEGRSAGSIPGVNSTPDSKTYPSIQVVGYTGPFYVVVSCVTKDTPHRPHPHNLVGKDGCSRGVYSMKITSGETTVTFANLGIQCVKRKDIEDALRIREELRVDPFGTGFDHKRHPTSIDLNAVRLCFQVFVEGREKGRFKVPLQPVVSDPIFDKKAMSDLAICKLSHCSASVAGGMEMILLCEKVAKEDIQVRFFEVQKGQLVWEGFGDFQPTHVHKQVAIAFRTPSYRTQQIDQPVQVNIQLRRPSDGVAGEALPFQMLPLGADDPDYLRRKRQKINNIPGSIICGSLNPGHGKRTPFIDINVVKTEPAERAPSFSAGSPTLYQVGTPSPQPMLLEAGNHPSPGRTPSPYLPYHVSSYPQLSPQYQSPENQIPQVPAVGSMLYPDPLPIDPQSPHVLHRVPDDQQSSPSHQAMIEETANLLELGSQQSLSMDVFQINSAELKELAVWGTPLSENLSTSLLISDDPIKLEPSKGMETEAANVGEGTSMTDSLTRLATTTMQELATINALYPEKNGS